MSTFNFCFYHDPCRSCDGWAAAMAVYNYTKGKVSLMGLNYNQDIPPIDFTGATVYVVDITPNDISELISILEKAEELHIYDHHEGAESRLEHLQEYALSNGLSQKLKIVFDTCRSGARIAWETLNGKLPEVVKFIDDYDRHIKQYQKTDDVVAAIRTIRKDPHEWNSNALNVTTASLASKGAAVLEFQRMLVLSIVKHKRFVKVLGARVPIVNCPDELVNEVLDSLTLLFPFAIAYSDQEKQRKYSVRSSKQSIAGDDINALTVAKHYGGGGHGTASGFYTPRTDPIIGESI